MSATAIREKWQTTIPQEVREAAGLQIDDQVEWSVTADGLIVLRKLVARGGPAKFSSKEAARAALEKSPLKFTASYDVLKKETR